MQDAGERLIGEGNRRRWVLAAGFLYALTFQKYVLRDPLSQSVGVQGVVEAGLIAVTWFIVVSQSRAMPKRVGVHGSVWFFGAYGLFALASSINSFDLKLSVVKSLLYFSVLMTAYLASELKMSLAFLDGVYRGYIATLLGAVALATIFPGNYPLFSVDSYSGRTRLALLATHPNSVGEVSGLLFLLAQVLPIRTRWYWQAFLLSVSVLAGEKTGTAALVVSVGLIFLFGQRTPTRRWAAVAWTLALACAGLVCVQFGVVSNSLGTLANRAAESIYGTKVSSELSSLDGRADVWRKGLELTQGAVVLGYGFEGARESLMSSVSWSGQAHNGFLQATLSAGFVGMLALIAGLYTAAADAICGDRAWKVKVLSLDFYLLSLAMIGPVFDSPSFFTIFLLITMLYAVLEGQTGFAAVRATIRSEIGATLSFAD